MRRRIASLPLFWRLFYANAAVLVVAMTALALAPVTVSVPVRLWELDLLLAGLGVLLVLRSCCCARRLRRS